MRALGAAIVIAALVVVGSSPAVAGPDHDTALTHLQRGVASFRAGDYAAALGEFRAAQQLAPDKPNPYRWLALTQVQLGDCPSALVNIAAFVERVPAGDARLAELIRLRELCLQTGVLRIESVPSDAALRIDGEQVGTTPYTSLSMRAGEHTVRASKSGFAAATRTVTITAGAEHDLQLQLARSSRPLVRQWWFWAAVAVGAAAVTGVSIALSDDPGATMLPPIQCDDSGCR